MSLINASNHTTHDCRHTVATLLDNAGANENAKRRILGHATGDVTDRVYTHKGLRQLRKAIMLLK
jgi:integrase